MQPDTGTSSQTLSFLCSYGTSSLFRQLDFTSDKVICHNDSETQFELPYSNINVAQFTPAGVQFITNNNNIFLRGIVNPGNAPMDAQASATDPAALKSIKSFLESKGIRTETGGSQKNLKPVLVSVAVLAVAAIAAAVVFLTQ